MKYFKFLALVLFLGFVVACEDDDDDMLSGTPSGGNNNPVGNYFNATLDGTAFQASIVFGQLDTNSVLVGAIKGPGDFPQVIMGIPLQATVGTYTYPVNIFDTTLMVPSILYSLNDSTAYVFNSGEIVLSVNDSVNNIVEGTFQGKFYEFSFAPDAYSIVVTNGQFRTSYN